METSDILKEMASLPIEAQKQVIDFIAFLKTRYPTVQVVPKTTCKPTWFLSQT